MDETRIKEVLESLRKLQNDASSHNLDREMILAWLTADVITLGEAVHSGRQNNV